MINVYAPVNCKDESVSYQKTSKEMNINDIEYLCDKLYMCSLTTEIDNIEEDTGIVYLVSLISRRE